MSFDMRGRSDPQFEPDHKPKKFFNNNKKSAFTIKSNVTVELDFDMALVLGKFIVDSCPENTAVMALGHQLCNLEDPDF